MCVLHPGAIKINTTRPTLTTLRENCIAKSPVFIHSIRLHYITFICSFTRPVALHAGVRRLCIQPTGNSLTRTTRRVRIPVAEHAGLYHPVHVYSHPYSKNIRPVFNSCMSCRKNWNHFEGNRLDTL